MTICPVAIAVGCPKCPVFKVCPAKTTLGNYDPDEKTDVKAPQDKSSGNTEG